MYEVVRWEESQTPSKEARNNGTPKILRSYLASLTVRYIIQRYSENSNNHSQGKVSIFHIQYQVFNSAKNTKDNFFTYAGIVNQECKKCKLKVLTENEFKCLIFVLGLKSPKDKEIQAKMLAKLEQDPDVTQQSITEECQVILNWKYDLVQTRKWSANGNTGSTENAC